MELIKFNDYLTKYAGTPLSVTLGDFDGVHKAHEVLIDKTIEKAKLNNYKSAIITFEPHPFLLFREDISNYLISTPEEKAYILKDKSLDFIILMDFTKEFAAQRKEEFIETVIDKLNVKEITVGSDFTFGINKEGIPQTFIELRSNISTEVVDLINDENVKISSTLLRGLIRDGEFDKLNKYLTHDFVICGTISKGSHIGKKIGLPTANIFVAKEHILPINGVYACTAIIDGIEHKGILNVGVNPSFNKQELRRLEVNIFDFDEDVYGKDITVVFKKFVRKEQVFPSVDAFLEQIRRDIESIKQL